MISVHISSHVLSYRLSKSWYFNNIKVCFFVADSPQADRYGAVSGQIWSRSRTDIERLAAAYRSESYESARI